MNIVVNVAKSLASVLILLNFFEASAKAETVIYTYDARGRVVQVTHTSTVANNNGVTTTYTHDNASNRVEVKTTGATH